LGPGVGIGTSWMVVCRVGVGWTIASFMVSVGRLNSKVDEVWILGKGVRSRVGRVIQNRNPLHWGTVMMKGKQLLQVRSEMKTSIYPDIYIQKERRK
jgi:hypothetical protein